MLYGISYQNLCLLSAALPRYNRKSPKTKPQAGIERIQMDGNHDQRHIRDIIKTLH